MQMSFWKCAGGHKQRIIGSTSPKLQRVVLLVKPLFQVASGTEHLPDDWKIAYLSKGYGFKARPFEPLAFLFHLNQ